MASYFPMLIFLIEQDSHCKISYIIQIRVFDGERVKRIKKTVELGQGAKILIPKEKLNNPEDLTLKKQVFVCLNAVSQHIYLVCCQC